MKLLITFLVLFFFVSDPQWLLDFSKAQQEAVQSKKMILLNFSGSDWCGPCIRLRKEILGSDVFNKYAADHLILVSADFQD